MPYRKLTIVFFILLLLAYGVVQYGKTVEPLSQDNLKIRAAQKTEEAYYLMAKKELSPNKSGLNAHDLIGLDYSGITTTLGNLNAKKTSVNPNFAAVIIDMLEACDLQAGDKIAINLSGSFPALDVAAIIAVETMGLDPIILSSIGSSTYGGNDPDWTYQDMEHMLYEAEIIKHKSLLVSPGGDGDIGSNMDPVVLKDVMDRLEKLGYRMYQESDLKKNMDYRMKLYEQSKVFINVGGNMVSQNDSDLGYFWEYGLIRPEIKLNYADNGLIGKFLGDGKPVIQMLNIMEIATEYGMPIAPNQVQKVGVGPVYNRITFSKMSVYIGISIFIMGAGIYGYSRKRYSYKKLIENVDQDADAGYAATNSCIKFTANHQRTQS